MDLKDFIGSQIAQSGPLPFERFMEIALYDTNGGFFGAGNLRSQKSGDFLTSPEVSALFGETLAEYVGSERDRLGEPFQLVEVAAGSGSLSTPLTRFLGIPGSVVEISPAARSALQEDFDVLDEVPRGMRGVVIANELLDNLPMALAQRIDGDWHERWVGASGGNLEFIDAKPRPEVLGWLDSYAGDVSEGGWVEVQMAASQWIVDTLGRIAEGSLVAIDYGDTAENLVPRRVDGTLRTYRSHHLGPHPLDEPGETDITADVNFSAMCDAAERAGATVRYLRQDDFLSELGLRDRLGQLRRAELEASRSGDEMERLRLRTLKTEVETLLHPRGLGDFRVMIAQVAKKISAGSL